MLTETRLRKLWRGCVALVLVRRPSGMMLRLCELAYTAIARLQPCCCQPSVRALTDLPLRFVQKYRRQDETVILHPPPVTVNVASPCEPPPCPTGRQKAKVSGIKQNSWRNILHLIWLTGSRSVTCLFVFVFFKWEYDRFDWMGKMVNSWNEVIFITYIHKITPEKCRSENHHWSDFSLLLHH